MTEEELVHFTGNKWESNRTPTEWKNFIDDVQEGGGSLTSLEIELYHDYVAMTEAAHRNFDVIRFLDAMAQIETLQHERGMLREALVGNIRELDALVHRNRVLLTLPEKDYASASANAEDDRCDSDPRKK
jgi:hypothetical protein